MTLSSRKCISKWDLKKYSRFSTGNARGRDQEGSSGDRTKHDVKQAYTERFQKKRDHEENDNNVRSAVQWGGWGSHKRSHPKEDARWQKRTSPAAGDTWGAIESRDMPPLQKDAEWRKKAPSPQGDAWGVIESRDMPPLQKDAEWKKKAPSPQGDAWGSIESRDMPPLQKDAEWRKKAPSPQGDAWGSIESRDMPPLQKDTEWRKKAPSPQGDAWGAIESRDMPPLKKDAEWRKKSPSPQGDAWGAIGSCDMPPSQKDGQWRKKTPSSQGDTWGVSSKEDLKWRWSSPPRAVKLGPSYGNKDWKWPRRTPSSLTGTCSWGASSGQDNQKWRRRSPPQAKTWGLSSGQEDPKWRRRTPSSQADTWGVSSRQVDPKRRKGTPLPQANTRVMSSGHENRRWHGRTPSPRCLSPRKRSRGHSSNQSSSRRELEHYGRSKRRSEFPGGGSHVKHFSSHKPRNVSSGIAYRQGPAGERYREKKTDRGERESAFEHDNDRVVNSGNGRELQLGSEETVSRSEEAVSKPKVGDELPAMAVKSSATNFSAQWSSQLMVDEPKLDGEGFHSGVLPPGNNVVNEEDFSPIRNIGANRAQLFYCGQQQLPPAFGSDSSAEQVHPVPSLSYLANVTKNCDLSSIQKQPEMDDHPPGFPSKPGYYGSITAVSGSNENIEIQNLSQQPQEEKMGGDKIADHSGPLENVDGANRAEGGENEKQMKKLRAFKVALIGDIKDMLKPLWKQGKLNIEAHRTIVKKVVNKVIDSLHGANIPPTKEKIDRYLLASKPKLTKLVQAYVEKLRKTGQ